MKILSLSTCPLDPKLGSGKTRLRWSEGLRALGHTVDIAEPKLFETWHGMRRALRFRQAWGACKFVKQKLEETDYDLVEFFGGEFGLITWQLSRLRNRPLIVAHTDGLELLASERELKFNPPRTPKDYARKGFSSLTHERLSRAAFKYADTFVTGCELDRLYVLDQKIFQEEDTATIHPGLDTEFLSMPFRAEKEHRVVFLGSWISRKGIDKLIAIMSDLLMRDQMLWFDVCGVGNSRDMVLAAFPFSLHQHIQVYEPLSTEQLAQVMSKASVFLFPSQYEGFGMALGEAMACSCAAVTTPTGFGAELRNGSEAIVCGFDDLEAMKNSVLRLLSNNDERIRIARAGWERVRSLKWESNIKKLDDTYQHWHSEWKMRWFRPKSMQSDSRAVAQLE